MNPNPNNSLPAVGCGDLFSSGGKVCTCCGKPKPFAAFNKRLASADGLAPNCKSCKKAYNLATREMISATGKAYRLANPEKVREKNREWRKANHDKARHAVKEWREANRERNSAGKRRWRESNPDKVMKSKRAYFSSNHERIRHLSNSRTNDLADSYVRSLLTERSSLTAKDIPQDLVELKRAHLKLHRTLKDNQP